MSDFHRHVPPNRFGRDFVIGDLHGHLQALQEALAAARFIPGRDRLFSVGDLIDRGPDSPGAAALLAHPWFHAVRGNHEDMLLRTLAGDARMLAVWRRNGGDWAFDGAHVNAVARGLEARIARLPHALTLHHKDGRRFGICHAECPVADWQRIGSAEHDRVLCERMLWARERVRSDQPLAVAGIDWTIHGHSIVPAPLRSANALFIETGVFRAGGRLTLLCLDDFH